MTRRALYTAPPWPSYLRLFGFKDPEPVEVEIVEYIEPTSRQHVRQARIIHPTDERSILGIAARSRGVTGPLPGLERIIPAELVMEIEAES